MKRAFLSFAVPAVFLLIATLVTAEEATTWGAVKKSTEDAPAAKKGVVTATAEALYFDDDSPAGWSATMSRHPNGINIKINAPSGLGELDVKPGYVYTVWMAIFDNPENCSDVLQEGCGADDEGFFDGNMNDAADPSFVGPVSAGVAGANGVNLNGHIHKGQPYDEIPLQDAPDFDDYVSDRELDNPMKAELHFLIRCHGPLEPGEVQIQMGTGELGEGECPECVDIQFGAFVDD